VYLLEQPLGRSKDRAELGGMRGVVGAGVRGRDAVRRRGQCGGHDGGCRGAGGRADFAILLGGSAVICAVSLSRHDQWCYSGGLGASISNLGIAWVRSARQGGRRVYGGDG
jgi:hypothetical protein